jgi:A/G-specific adenine glycosylase
MDLGATVCTRTRPACTVCPLRADCRAAREGRQAALPSPRPRRARPQRSVRVAVVRDSSRRILLERRPAAGVWGGLFSLPELADDEDSRLWCARVLNARVSRDAELPTIAHAFTHFDLTIAPTLLELDSDMDAVMDRPGWLWYKPAMDSRIGLAAPIAALLESLRDAPAEQR